MAAIEAMGLAAESHGVEGEKVGRGGYLGRGVTLKRHAGVGLRHAAAVVDHLYECAARILEDDGDGVGAGVNGVLDKFLDDGGGALYHLACGNLIGN